MHDVASVNTASFIAVCIIYSGLPTSTSFSGIPPAGTGQSDWPIKTSAAPELDKNSASVETASIQARLTESVTIYHDEVDRLKVDVQYMSQA